MIRSDIVPEECKPFLVHDRDACTLVGEKDNYFFPPPPPGGYPPPPVPPPLKRPTEGEISLTLKGVDGAGKEYLLARTTVPVEQEVKVPFKFPPAAAPGDGKLVAKFEAKDAEPCTVEIPIKLKKVAKRIIKVEVKSPKPGAEIIIGKSYDFVFIARIEEVTQ